MILSEAEFYDYKTAPVDGTDVVDLHTTGMSFYNDFLSKNKGTIDYLYNEKNLKGDVVMMSPNEYYQACSDYGFPDRHPSVEKLKLERSRDKNTLEHLQDVLRIYKKKFPMPILNKAHNSQEGLHRMMVIGDLFGWDHKVPVLVVEHADPQRAYEQQKRERKQRIEYNIQKAVEDALEYKFSNIEELKEQIQWELDRRFEYNQDDIEIPVNFEFTSDKESFKISVGSAEYSFDYDDVKFSEEETDDFIDDLDLEETEDFLVRYFGSNWRETDPHLKDIYNIS